MANEMIKFYKGALGSLPTTGVNGAIYITTDEGGIYLGTGEGMKRLGDFIQVASVSNLPTDGANASALYYCVQENILAKYDSAKGWQQINKQPTAEEMKALLSLGTMAYKSEVAEADLTAALQEKINTVAEDNHTHTNKDELDLIAAGDVAKWNAAEGNAKTYADGLDSAMNTRVEALEAIDHEHANKDLLDTYTQTEADLADAVAKKHAHTFNEAELNKIVEGDVAKWNGVAADHLTSADKTTLENAIKEAKKAGTDANTALEAYKVTNDAAIDAIEEDIVEITDGTNGILAQAKGYSDGKLATARTEISAEIDADVKVVADELAGYKTSNDAALSGVKATAEAAATKVYVDTELDKKVDKTDYEADKATFATKTEVSDVDKKFASYRTAADQDTIDNGHKERIEALEAKFTGDNSVDAKIAAAVKAEEDARKEAVKDVQDEVDAVEGRMTTAEGKITALEGASATHATKDELNAVDAKFANYKTAEAQKAIDDAQDAAIKAIADDYVKAADIADFETKENVKKVADGLAEYIESNDKALADVETIAKAAAVKTEVEAELAKKADKTAVEAIAADYLKAADKTALEAKITAEESRAKGVEEGLQTQINTIMNNPDTEGVINSINEFTQYITEHGAIAEGFRTDIDKNADDIAANAKAIEDHIALAEATYVTKDEAVTSWDDLEDKPFGKIACDGVYTLDYNSITESTPRIERDGLVWVKVSSDVLTADQLVGAQYQAMEWGNLATYTLEADNINETGDVIEVSYGYSMPIVIVPDIVEAAQTGIEYGTYFYFEGPDYYVCNLTLAGLGVKTLDEMFIPDTIARTADVDAQLDGLMNNLGGAFQGVANEIDGVRTETNTKIAEATEELKADASNKDAVVLAEAQAYAEQKVTEIANNFEGFAMAIFEALTWGSFEA